MKILLHIFVFLFGNKVKANYDIYGDNLEQFHFKYRQTLFLIILYTYTETAVISKELSRISPLKNGWPTRDPKIYI